MSFESSFDLLPNWQLKTVQELVNEKILEKPLDGNHGGIHPKASDYVEEGIPFVMASDLEAGLINFSSCKHISPQQAGTLRKGFAKEGDVLLSHKATIGRTAIVQPNDNEYIVLTPQVTYYRVKDETKLNNIYLKSYFDSYFFQTILNQWAGSGSTRAYLGITEQLKLPVIVPPIESQIEIASFAHNFNSKIHLNTQINQTLESIAQAIFKSWFIDFDPVRAKIAAKQEGKDAELAAMCMISGKSEEELKQMSKDDFAELQATAALFPDELVESELGEVPKGWEYKKLKNLCRVINGRAYKNTEFKEEGIPIVRIQNLTGGGKTVFSDLDLPQDKLIEKEDFIYAWSATFGPYIWRGPKSIYHYHIWKMDVDETIISRYFLYLTMFRKTESMKSAGTGSIFTHLTKVIMESQDVLIADNAINMLFKDRIDKIFKLISLKSDEIKNLKNIRDTLLPKLLSGKVEIPDFINEGE